MKILILLFCLGGSARAQSVSMSPPEEIQTPSGTTIHSVSGSGVTVDLSTSYPSGFTPQPAPPTLYTVSQAKVINSVTIMQTIATGQALTAVQVSSLAAAGYTVTPQ
jgi:hypothetical protein